MPRKVGDRVGVVSHQDNGPQGTLYLFGYGVYEGDFVPEEAAGWMAEVDREVKATNPRLRLDNGKVVYGCESWWGSEEKVKQIEDAAKKAGAPVVILDIDEVRKKFKEAEAAKKKMGSPED
jgi:hypothetical protein